MESMKEVWSATLEKLREHPEISSTAFDMWLACIEPRAVEENAFVVFVNSPFQRNIIKQQYKDKICDALESVLQFRLDLKILCNEVEEEGKPLVVMGSNDEFTFDTFIVGEDNKFAHAAAQSVAQNPAANYNPLFIYGNSGLGKTHLLFAIRNEILKKNPNTNVVYATCETFVNEFVETVKTKDVTDFKEKYRNADILLIDDIQFLSRKEETQTEFFHTFDYLYRSQKQIVLTSDRPPKEIATLTDRLRTRFEQGLLADIGAPNLETRIAIIKSKAEQIGMVISNEVCEYIASQLKTNIRQLEGVVKTMRAQYLLTGEVPSLAAAQNAIRVVKRQKTPLTVDRVFEEVARTFSVTPDDIRSRKNTANISRARQTAAKVLCELLEFSQEKAGAELGGRDHSSINYALSQVDERMKADESYRLTVDDIIKNLKSID